MPVIPTIRSREAWYQGTHWSVTPDVFTVRSSMVVEGGHHLLVVAWIYDSKLIADVVTRESNGPVQTFSQQVYEGRFAGDAEQIAAAVDTLGQWLQADDAEHLHEDVERTLREHLTDDTAIVRHRAATPLSADPDSETLDAFRGRWREESAGNVRYVFERTLRRARDG